MFLVTMIIVTIVKTMNNTVISYFSSHFIFFISINIAIVIAVNCISDMIFIGCVYIDNTVFI